MLNLEVRSKGYLVLMFGQLCLDLASTSSLRIDGIFSYLSGSYAIDCYLLGHVSSALPSRLTIAEGVMSKAT